MLLQCDVKKTVYNVFTHLFTQDSATGLSFTGLSTGEEVTAASFNEAFSPSESGAAPLQQTDDPFNSRDPFKSTDDPFQGSMYYIHLIRYVFNLS